MNIKYLKSLPLMINFAKQLTVSSDKSDELISKGSCEAIKNKK